MTEVSKIRPAHLSRDAYVYVRQSTLTQVREHTESLERQYELAERAQTLGWPGTRMSGAVQSRPCSSGSPHAARSGLTANLLSIT